MRPFLENIYGSLRIAPPPVQPFPEHLHTQVEMVYLFDGTLEMVIDGRKQRLEAGDLCVCFPGVIHGYVSQTEAKGLMLIFQPEVSADFPALLARTHPTEPVLRLNQLSPDVAVCMEQLRNEQQGVCDERVIKGYIQVVLARTLPLLPLVNREPEMSDVVYEIMKYLSVHCTESIHLEDLAHALGVSKSYLSHTFSQRIGMNFRSYVNALRADRACMLLRNSTQSITNIAYECGFETQRTFNRVFAEQYGTTPSEYRQHYQAARAISD